MTQYEIVKLTSLDLHCSEDNNFVKTVISGWLMYLENPHPKKK